MKTCTHKEHKYVLLGLHIPWDTIFFMVALETFLEDTFHMCTFTSECAASFSSCWLHPHFGAIFCNLAGNIFLLNIPFALTGYVAITETETGIFITAIIIANHFILECLCAFLLSQCYYERVY